MKSSGTLRYINNQSLLSEILHYVTATNFAQYRTENFEQKYYTEIFLPTLYRNYDLHCMHYLDSAYTNRPSYLTQLENHRDVLTGDEAEKFRQEVGSALMLRLERLRVTIKGYHNAKESCLRLKNILQEEID